MREEDSPISVPLDLLPSMLKGAFIQRMLITLQKDMDAPGSVRVAAANGSAQCPSTFLLINKERVKGIIEVRHPDGFRPEHHQIAVASMRPNSKIVPCAKPYVQLYRYMIQSGASYGVFFSWSHSVFATIAEDDNGLRILRFSRPVKRLSKDPHMVQAWLYFMKLVIKDDSKATFKAPGLSLQGWFDNLFIDEFTSNIEKNKQNDAITPKVGAKCKLSGDAKSDAFHKLLLAKLAQEVESSPFTYRAPEHHLSLADIRALWKYPIGEGWVFRGN
eukprot:Plantae.Rhodophyta-Hildenbrandia_rubra.ctg12940.p1 GENE.Plantae.Rhodophyta-Hildenbrandia_rubra.ctg12940~~Plantae.Rhodophyta-Hildenbrandia_rubra.ctg12940.p1  ORF type:complete len:274 (+),score=33.25 Plantae.Rhodophyta-Hildenbrandia_rubra.ctg12940:669-1490(+)